VRRLVGGERVTFSGRYWNVEDAVLLPKPSRRPPLMVGSNGPRMLHIALPHVDAWNTWYQRYGNTPEGFAKLNASVTEAADRCTALGLGWRSEELLLRPSDRLVELIRRSRDLTTREPSES
jgi:alkanesulfonate monooxygenase SsuD/methylene tetrahydromethanopterin reductase-like flavin-dependent oxidoreductase (luciferase family)